MGWRSGGDQLVRIRRRQLPHTPAIEPEDQNQQRSALRQSAETCVRLW